MKYQSKLYLSFLAIAITSVTLGLSIIYFEGKKLLFNEISEKVLSVAASAGAVVDGDLLKEIKTANDMDSSAYREIQEKITLVRESNQREDTHIRFIYIIRPVVGEPGYFKTVVDSKVGAEPVSKTGNIHTSDTLMELQNHLDEYFRPKELIYDEDGTWLIAYSPIVDSSGEYSATLGAVVSAKVVFGEYSALFYYGMISFVVTILIALLAAHILSKKMSQSLGTLCKAVKQIGKGDLEQEVHLPVKDEFMSLGFAINRMCKGLREMERLKMSFSRYVSRHVLEKILKSDKPLHLEGERKKITVLFSDIRQFTLLAESLPPEEVVSLLNEYFEFMLDPIFENNGTLDKFIGDGIMVEFGSPLEDEDQEKHAVKAAIDMQNSLKKLLSKWEEEGKPKISIGIGIHTGEAVVGNIGTMRRMEFTAIGDTVNIAARIEQETKRLKDPILVSESTWKKVKDDYDYEEYGEVELEGRISKIKIYAISQKV